jgi:hypothetical protein
MDTKKVPFPVALRELAEIAGVELPSEKKKLIRKDVPIIELPGRSSNHQFAKELGNAIKNNDKLFYNPISNRVCEIGEFYDKYLDKTFTSLIPVAPVRLINILDDMVQTVKINASKPYEPPQPKTMSETLARYLLENDNFKNSLYKVSRLLKSCIPFLVDNQCYIPHHGYNESILAFVTKDAPEIGDKVKTLEDAKYIIEDLFKEFCFKEEIDKTMSLAGFITPLCRGLYKTPTTRTPLFMYIANRERAGKDYLAGINGIVYEGVNVDFPPITTNEYGGTGDEELRKKITSAVIKGRRRYHSQNNKGMLDSSFLEQVTTSEYFEDRLLGGNESREFPNEMDFSLSGNLGLRWTPDIFNRSRIINLFLAIENPNKRQFTRPNLHHHIMANRDIIQSALIFIVKEWFKAGMPEGKTFSSFPEWSRVVGGIMEFCGWGDPTILIEQDDDIGGDIEGRDMKKLVETMVQVMDSTNQQSFLMKEMCDIIEELNKPKDEKTEPINIFSDLIDRDDKMNRGGRTAFAKTFKKYIGRIFSGYEIVIAENKKRTANIKYSFVPV